MAPGPRKKIAVLGGGVGALTTALALTAEEDWQEKYEITVYQMGWRLGGKGASGRSGQVVLGADGRKTISGPARIEEHGLHIWLGFYDNAFRLIQQVYRENEPNLPPGAPLREWTDAFKKHSFVCVEEDPGTTNWRNWFFNFPEDDRVPGDNWPPVTVWDYINLLLESLLRYHKQSTHAGEPVHPQERTGIRAELDRVWGTLGHIRTEVSAAELAFGTELLEMAHRLAQSRGNDVTQHTDDHHRALLVTVTTFHTWMRKRFRERALNAANDVRSNDLFRRDFIVMDLGLTIIRGLFEDGVLFHPQGLDSLEEEFQSWLQRHGAWDGSCLIGRSAVMRGLYDLVFAFIDGDVRQPSFATGPALRSVLNLLLRYKGAIFWKMQAGMGDTVFAPIYMVLEQRGVRFQFFHKVENLGLNEQKTAVETIRIGRQIHLKDHPVQYDPLVWVKDIPCWPANPDYDQIVEGEQLKDAKIDLESSFSPWQSVEQLTLRAGVDFDQVVLGISLGALAELCHELVEAAPATWGRMVATVKTVRTMGFQFWVNQDLAELGWEQSSPVLDAYVEPLNTWADMSQLLVREDWSQDGQSPPKSVAYFCGQMLESVVAEEGTAFVRRTAEKFAKGPLRQLWPGLHNKSPQQFLAYHAGETDEDAMDSQYFRANVHPTERYVMSVAGSTSARLRADQAGFEGLVLTGDWINNGFNAGCVEAAVMAGLQAANVVSGRPLAYGIASLRQNFGREDD